MPETGFIYLAILRRVSLWALGGNGGVRAHEHLLGVLRSLRVLVLFVFSVAFCLP